MTSPRAAGGVAAASATPMATPAVPLTTPNTATSARSGTLSLTCGNNAVATDPARTPPTAYGADRWVRSISHPAGTRAAVFAMPRTRKTSPMAAGERRLAAQWKEREDHALREKAARRDDPPCPDTRIGSNVAERRARRRRRVRGMYVNRQAEREHDRGA